MSQSATLTIMSLTSDMIRVYPVLRDIIKEAESKDDPKKYINFRMGGVRGNWFAKNYLSVRRGAGMKNALAKINCKEAQAASKLQTHMIKETAQFNGATNNKNFQYLSIMLPKALEAMAKQDPINRTSLLFLAKRIVAEDNVTYKALEALFDRLEEEKPKESNDDLTGQQNSLVEQIISAALSTIDSKNAHRIRQMIAKCDNKLEIVQLELAKI